MIKFRRVTVSLLVPSQDNRNQILIVKFKTKRESKFGIPGGGLELYENIFQAAQKEALEELGLDFPATEDAWKVFAIRCNPLRDSVPNRKLSKIVLGNNPLLESIEGTAEHNFDIVLLSSIGCKDYPSTLKPTDNNEVEKVFFIDVDTPPEKSDFPISDDIRLIKAYKNWLNEKSELPVIIY